MRGSPTGVDDSRRQRLSRSTTRHRQQRELARSARDVHAPWRRRRLPRAAARI